ncbi:hypothetical protein HII36_50705 [Nonomuraea sp. NN258]|uniref:hypothetical protein n=1 Tax=Nonomuraea antri TaxID=2730852 RepID=UPI0015687B99|nr:hypothetical protein [Nonomuraea antri]NRQ40043.1 hypothetical protein [Nonomuraea antri]
MTLFDLRYSAACLRRFGDRPRPELVRRRVAVYDWARADRRDRWVARRAAVEERRARQRLRLRLEAIRRTANTVDTSAMPPDAGDDFDVTPARHRRNAVWLA